MSKKKIILKIIFVLFLLAGVFILQPKTLVFADAEVEEETVQEVEIDEIITEESKEEVIEEEKVEETNTVEPQVESQEKPQENFEITLQEESQTEPQINSQDEPQEEPQKNTEAIEKTVEENAKNSQLKKSVIKNNKSTPNEIEVETPEEFNAIITDLNNNGGSKTIKLKKDIALTNQNPQLINGELTILGEGYTLTVSISVGKVEYVNGGQVFKGGILNLGRNGYTQALILLPGKSDLCIINVDGNGIVNIYNEVILKDCTRAGQAGGITAVNNSTVNMYGGTITNCNSKAVSGGIYLDGHSVLNMYGGTISNCTGPIGGAIGLSGGSPIAPSTAGPVAFNMYGGIIENCVSNYYGGGAICCAYSYYPVTLNIYEGIIRNCKTQKTNYYTYNYGGGAIYILSLSDFTFLMNGGMIINCDSTSSRFGYGGAIMIYTSGQNSEIKFTKGTITKNNGNFGGGIFLWKGDATIADGFSLHNNTAIMGGDDIYNNANTVILGTVDTSATLDSCGHKIDGWYEDAENRWSYNECTGEDDYYVLFEQTGITYSGEYGLKAAHGEPIIEPDEPDEPVVPDEPAIPDEPIVPDKPVVPDEPIILDEPDKQEEPTITTKPKEPTKSTLTPKPTNKSQFTLTTQNPMVIADTPKLTAEYSETNTIPNPETPMAAPEEKYWALLNLILSILTVIFGLIFVLYRKDDDLEVEDKRKANIAKVIAALVSIASVIVFIFTEDMTTTMTWIDKWTILMAIILIGEFIIDYYIHKKSQNDEEEEEEEELDG